MIKFLTLRASMYDSLVILFKELLNFSSTSSIYCNTSDEEPRPYIQADFRKEVFQAIHDLAHKQ